MRAVPNMRAQISVSQAQLALDSGACVSYFGCDHPCRVWIEGKPDHLKSLERHSAIVFFTELELVPSKVLLKGSEEYDFVLYGSQI